MPSNSTLSQNYPNPFNPSTKIEFTLPKASRVTLEVYDLLGQKVRTLAYGHMAAGRHSVSWNGADDAGRQVASGTYFYRLNAGSTFETRKMMLIK